MLGKRVLGTAVAGAILLVASLAAGSAVHASETPPPCSETATKHFAANCDGFEIKVFNRLGSPLTKSDEYNIFQAPDTILPDSPTMIYGDWKQTLGTEGRPVYATGPSGTTRAFYKTPSGRTYGVKVEYDADTHVTKGYCGVIDQHGSYIDDSKRNCYFTNSAGNKQGSGTPISPYSQVKVTFL